MLIDFVRLCIDRNIPFLESGHHHCAEGWVQVHCPFCSDGSHGWHLGFSLEGGNLNCWKCGSHSFYEYSSATIKGTSYKQLQQEYSTAIVLKKKKQKVRRRFAKKPPRMTNLYPVHENYLRSREFPKQIIKEWDLKATSGMCGQWSWRIIAPVRDTENNIVAYTGRALKPNVRPRWMTTKNEDMSIDPKKLLYGIQKIKNRVLIVEGVSDVWRMGPGSIALMGIDWKQEQAALLRKYKYRYIMFDPEKQAQKRAQELADWLSPFKGETEIITELKSDPGSLGQNQADSIMRELGF